MSRADQLAATLGGGWHVRASSTGWVQAQPVDGDDGPAQGWKLHASAATRDHEQVLAAMVPALVAHRVPFKVAADADVLAALNDGTHGWSQVGKFLTAYPPDDATAVRLAVALDEATRGHRGPRVASDRPLRPGSLVHYRYGAFVARWHQNALGEPEAVVEAPDGTLEPDHRWSVYHQPAWVDDPFKAAGVAEPLPAASLLLRDRYLVGGTLEHRPQGTVLLCLDVDRRERCVVKCLPLDDGSEAPASKRARVRSEAEALRDLDGCGGFPRLVDTWEDDDEIVVVMEQVPGRSLEDLITTAWSQGTPLAPADVRRWFAGLARRLLELERAGYANADLKAPHVLVEDDRIGLIDAEGLVPLDPGRPYWPMVTPGYASPHQRSGGRPGPADTVHAFGALLWSALTGCDPSHAPDRTNLGSRPLALLAPAAPADLVALVTAGLDPDPDRRPTLDAVVAELDGTLDPGAPRPRPRSTAGHGPARPARRDGLAGHGFAEALDRAADRLLAGAVRHPDGSVAWSEADGGPTRLDLGTGTAGIVHALATVPALRDRAGGLDLVAAGARTLAAGPDRPHPGLFVGDAGVALARAAAALATDDAAGRRDALALADAVGTRPHGSPDLYNGTAGRLRAHVALWHLVGDDGQLDHARAAADVLVRTARFDREGRPCWPIPDGYGTASGRTYLGYAHGAAGIADALLDWRTVDPSPAADDLIDPLIAGVIDLLAATARAVGTDALGWPAEVPAPAPDGADQPIAAPPGEALWCHGAAGIARFLLRARAGLPDVDPLLRGALRGVAATSHLGPSYCHGLAGNVDVLLDAAAALDDPHLMSEAHRLGLLLVAGTAPPDRIEPPGEGSLRPPSLLLGDAGIGAVLARLAGAPAPQPARGSAPSFPYA